jgi:hypothetical protein
MKKIIGILVLVLAFTLTTQGQKKGGKLQVDKVLKRLTADLNLTADQQKQIKPLLEAQIADRKAMTDLRKMQGESGAKPSKEDRKKMREDRVAKETAMNTKMASILDKEQLVKYQEISKKKKGKGKKMKKKNSDNK